MNESNLVPFRAFFLFQRFDTFHEIRGILVQVLQDRYSLCCRKIIQLQGVKNEPL